MIKHSFRQRALEIEEMDDFSICGEELNRTLCFLAIVNRFLGGHQLIIDSLKKAFFQLKWVPAGKGMRLLDVGCGGGDTLRLVAQWSKEKQLDLKINGIDANPHVLAFARKNTASFPHINYLEGDFLQQDFEWGNYDVILCSLILHHFDKQQLISFFQAIPSGKIIIINDLHRHWLAFYLFQLFGWLTRAPAMAKKDGAISIRKGFIRKELESIMASRPIQQYHLRWRWAFRYQLILVT